MSPPEVQDCYTVVLLDGTGAGLAESQQACGIAVQSQNFAAAEDNYNAAYSRQISAVAGEQYAISDRADAVAASAVAQNAVLAAQNTVTAAQNLSDDLSQYALSDNMQLAYANLSAAAKAALTAVATATELPPDPADVLESALAAAASALADAQNELSLALTAAGNAGELVIVWDQLSLMAQTTVTEAGQLVDAALLVLNLQGAVDQGASYSTALTEATDAYNAALVALDATLALISTLRGDNNINQ